MNTYIIDDLVNGEWITRDATPEEAAETDARKALALDMRKAEKWEEIKAERDRRKAGGIKVNIDATVGDKWFHSDDASRIQQIGLVMMGANIPAGLQWKTMDGSFVTMTQSLANAIFNAAASLDQAVFARAEEHRTAMEAATNPATYDFTQDAAKTKWPIIFGE